MPGLRVIVEDPAAHRADERVFRTSPIRIGRSSLNDLALESSYVSQYHAVLSFDETAIEYVDLGSTNGSLVGGSPLKPFVAAAISDGGTVTIGPLVLKLLRSNEREVARSGDMEAQTVEVARPTGTVVDPGAVKNLRQAQAMIDTARPAFEAYRSAWAELLKQLRAALVKAAPQVRVLAVPSLQAAYAGLSAEPEFRQLVRELGLGETERPNGAGIIEVAGLLGLSDDELRADADGRQLLSSVADVLEAFAASFVELRRGIEQFGSEVAVKAFSRQTGLHAAESGRDVLAYLVSRHENGRHRVDELKGAFADIMIHQVALITGIMEGVRSLLMRLDPESIAADLERDPERIGGLPVRRGLWPLSVTALWRRFRRLHADLVEEDRGATSVVFGREFARSYGAAKMRHRGSGEGTPVGFPERRGTQRESDDD
jgi:type VI secretion system protein ImpI